MATSVYFSGAVKSEQDLYEDLVTESIKIFGQDVVYIPRTRISEDALLNEEWSQYTMAFPIEMYLENAEGFEGDGNTLGKFGLEIRDQADFDFRAAEGKENRETQLYATALANETSTAENFNSSISAVANLIKAFKEKTGCPIIFNTKTEHNGYANECPSLL